MRICLLSARFPPQRCGVGDYTCFLAGALARLGLHVDVLTAVGELDEVLYPTSPKVHIHRVIEGWQTKRLPAMIRHIRKLNPQALLIQYTPQAFDRRGLTFAVNLLPMLARIFGRIRVVTNFHEVHIPFDGSVKQRFGAAWQQVAARLLASSSHGLSVTAVDWDRCLRRLGVRGSIELIPVGSNIPRTIVPEGSRAQLRRQLLGSPDGTLVVGFGARHDRDMPAALFALRQLKNQQRAKLLWIGGGSPPEPYRLRIAEAMSANGLGEDDVEWMGALPHPMVSKLLGVCDVMLLPFVDGISTRRTSAMTALQHELPLLTTRGNHLEPWFVHGENVFLVPSGDRQVLADALVELVASPELRARLAKGARTTYEAHFSWEIIAEQVASLL